MIVSQKQPANSLQSSAKGIRSAIQPCSWPSGSGSVQHVLLNPVVDRLKPTDPREILSGEPGFFQASAIGPPAQKCRAQPSVSANMTVGGNHNERQKVLFQGRSSRHPGPEGPDLDRHCAVRPKVGVWLSTASIDQYVESKRRGEIVV